MKPRLVSLSQYTTLGVGGPGELWVCHTFDELLEATSAPYRILGGGSNLLVSDDGIPERVIKLAGEFARADLKLDVFEGDIITGWIGAARPIPGLLRALQQRGLSGLEGLWGVPANVGGAVRMNAGTRFGEMADALFAVELAQDGEIEVFDPSSLGFSYRNSRLPTDSIITRVRLKLIRSNPAIVQAKMDEADLARKDQPHNRTFGCAFKNPKGKSAGQLIDLAGLKGTKIGGAMISLEHGNFIVNSGNATAKDVFTLIELIEEKVNIPLKREVEIWGEI